MPLHSEPSTSRRRSRTGQKLLMLGIALITTLILVYGLTPNPTLRGAITLAVVGAVVYGAFTWVSCRVLGRREP
jgi:hypothetical protein